MEQKAPGFFETKKMKDQRHVKEYVYFLMKQYRCSEAEAWEKLALMKSADFTAHDR